MEHNEVHSFTCGIMEHGGYTRKRLDYRYYDKECQMILFSRTDVTNVYLEEQKKSQRMEELLWCVFAVRYRSYRIRKCSRSVRFLRLDRIIVRNRYRSRSS